MRNTRVWIGLGLGTALYAPAVANAQPRAFVDIARPAPAPRQDLGAQGRPVRFGPLPLFLNFDGVDLVYGKTADSTQNMTYYDDMAVAYAPYGDMAKRAAVLQAMREQWAAYNVEITDARPPAGPYVMAVVSPTNPVGYDFAIGLAPLDCDDLYPNDVVWAFHSGADTYSVVEQAHTIGQEIAHSFGLEHSTRPEDVMSWEYGVAQYSFVDACEDLLTTAEYPEACPAQHRVHCEEGQQNSHAELLSMLGPDGYMPEPPEVTIVFPEPGAIFDEGEDFTIEATVEGEAEIVATRLFVDGEAQGTDAIAPYSWMVFAPPVGHYEVYVEAEDVEGVVGVSSVVEFSVSEEPEIPDDGGESTGSVDEDDGDGDGNGDDESGSESGDDGFGEVPVDVEQEAADSGCGCTTHAPGRAGLSLLALALLGVRRRRLAPAARLA